MADIIRELVEEDLYEISKLYDFRKSEPELKWLFSDPYKSENFNAFVSINDDNEITGVIGYAKATYSWNDSSNVGVIPMSWKIKDSYKGMAGVLLFKKVMSLGDFNMAVEGSEMAQNLYSLFKLKQVSKADVYYKVFNLVDYYKSLKEKGFLEKVKLLGVLFSTRFINAKKKPVHYEVKLTPYSPGNSSIQGNQESVFSKVLSEQYVDWLLNCPVLKTYAFNIIIDKVDYGLCVLYLQKVNGIMRGRIVHLPNMGINEKIWSSVIDKCLSFFKEKKCCSITTLAHHKMYHSCFLDSGFKKIKKHSKPIFIKDINNVLSSVDLKKNWNFQYSEGDKAYRSI